MNKMKVYILTEDEIDYQPIVGVFDSVEKAKASVDQLEGFKIKGKWENYPVNRYWCANFLISGLGAVLVRRYKIEEWDVE